MSPLAAWTSRSATLIAFSCSAASSEASSEASSALAPSAACVSSSATYPLRPLDQLGVDLLQTGPLFETRNLTLGRILLGNGQERRRAELLGDRHDPLYQFLDGGPGRAHVAASQVDHLAREAPANRTPEVLLDHPVRLPDERLALVYGPGTAGYQREGQGCQRARFAQIGLGVRY